MFSQSLEVELLIWTDCTGAGPPAFCTWQHMEPIMFVAACKRSLLHSAVRNRQSPAL